MPEKIDAMAKAGYEAMRERGFTPTPDAQWDELFNSDQDNWRHVAWAMYRALAKPTEAMVAAGANDLEVGYASFLLGAEQVWAAMHDVAGK